MFFASTDVAELGLSMQGNRLLAWVIGVFNGSPRTEKLNVLSWSANS